MPEIKNQPCTFCGDKKLTLREEEVDIPHFGRVFVLCAECEGCGYRKSDVEPAENKEPCKYTLEVDSEDDLNIKIVKSGEAILKIPHVITIEPGPVSEGYITNVEGLLERVKKIVQSAGESEDDDSARKKAKNMVKKLNKVILGREKIKIILEDKSGHSAIISEKAVKSKV
jgi:zinc finger protein